MTAPLHLWVHDDAVSAEALAGLRGACTPQALAQADVEQSLDTTGRVAEVPLGHHPACLALAEQLTGLLGLANAHGDTLRLRAYHPGQGHPEHLDDYRIGSARLVATALVYLTDCQGGETVFPAAHRQVSPAAGRVALWLNVDAGGRPAAGSAHRAAPVREGEKWVLAWFVYATPDQVATAAARGHGHIAALGAVEPARWRPAQTLTVVDDDVPEETLDLLEEACEERGLGFAVADARRLAPGTGPLPPGSLLYCAGTSLAADEAQARLYGPGVATFFQDPRGPLWDCGLPDLALERAGLPMPRAVRVTTTARPWLRDAVAYVGGLPVVLKTHGGEGGVGVMLAESWPALLGLVDHLLAQGSAPRLMAYIPDGEHWRVVVVGDRAVAAYPNPVAPDDFRSEPSEDLSRYTDAPDPELAALAVEATHALGLAFAGVDLLLHPSGRVYVLEANFPCYFPHAQEEAGVDVAGPMVDWLLAKAQRLAGSDSASAT